MQLHSISNFTQSSRKVWLYSAVYTGKISAYAVLILFASFLIQPIHKAIASESIEVVEDDLASIVFSEKLTEGLNVTQNESSGPSGNINPTNLNNQIEEQESEETNDSATEEQITDVIDEESDINDETLVPTVDNGAEQSEQDQIGSGEQTSSNNPSGDSDQSENELETTLESGTTNDNPVPDQTVIKDPIDGKVIERGVTDLVGSVVNEAVMLARQMVTEENYYQFSRQSCVAVGDGTFHCTTNERTSIDQNTAIFADRGENGNMEIYMRTARGEVIQLTDNSYDDTSPDLDSASMRAVWQRMIDGRYQIISYDLRERKETQLTFSRTNSMEPKVSRNGIVWQEWDGNDWEIMFFDGTFTNQITDNDVQDVTPTIEEGYILWSVLGGLTPEAKVYTIETGQTMTITGHDGGAVANPRFVLVYDTKFDNGDIITQGFDPVTGLATPISAKAGEKPFDIPEPDPIGEIRALINNKSTQKDTEIITVPISDDGGDLNLNSSTTKSQGETLILTDAEYDNEVELAVGEEVDEDELVLTEYDLVITESSSSTNSVLNKKYNLGTTTATSTQE